VVIVAKPSTGPQPVPRPPAKLRSVEPGSDPRVSVIHPQLVPPIPVPPHDDLLRPEIHSRPESRAPTPLQPEEPHDDLHVPEKYKHLGQRFTPPPSQFPERKRKGFERFKSKLREFFGFSVKH